MLSVHAGGSKQVCVMIPTSWWADDNLSKLALSVMLVLLSIGARVFVTRFILRHVGRADVRRQWVVKTRNLFLFLLLAALVAIWAEAVRTFALSVLALGVAFVIATKELLQSLLGSMFRSATSSYSVGDRIEIGGYRGDVIDVTPFTTSILEVGPGKSFHLRTGRVITFTNNKLLDTFVLNESYTKRYVIHVFTVPMKLEEDWQRAERVLLEEASAECEHYLDFAAETMKHLEKSHGLDGLPVRPRVSVQIAEPGRVNLLVRVPSPVGRQGQTEQAIVRRFLQRFYARKEPEPEPQKSETQPSDLFCLSHDSRSHQKP